MRDIAITLIVFGSIPFIFKRPHIGIYMWAWIGYMNPHKLAFGFSQEFPFAAVIGAVTLVSLLVSKETKKLPLSPIIAVWLTFVLWMCVTTYFSLNPEYAWKEWDRTMKIQLLTFCTIMLMTDRKRLEVLVWIIAFSIGFFGIKGGIFSILTGGNYLVWGPPGGFISGNNEIAFALIIVLPLMRYLQMTVEKKWVSLAITAAMLLCVLAVITTYSRGAFLAISAMGVFMILKSRHRALMMVVMVCSLPVMLAFVPDKWTDRMSTITAYEEDGSAMGRINAWWFGYNLAKDRPIVGGGFQTFTPELFHKYAPIPEDYHDSHSIYFEVLAEQGFPGLTLFLLLGLLAMRTAQLTIRRARDRPDLKWASDLSKMTQVSIVGYAVGGAFLGLAYFDLYYHLVAISVIVRLIAEKSVRVEQQSEKVTVPKIRKPRAYGV